VTKRAILLLKQSNPEWGCRRISDVLYRGKGYPASAKAVARVLKEAGYEFEDVPTVPHRDKVRRFERGAPCELWQTDLFSFMLKRQNRRVHLVAFLDDHSRYIVSFGLAVTASTELVLEALRQGIAAYGAPKELLTDNGSQYVTWRGKSQFTKQCEARGIRQIVARPRHPQTLGKTERFWGTLWRELLSVAVFVDLGDAQARIGHFIDHYNFRRPHRGIDGSVPADRFFGAAPEVKATLDARVKANAAELARDGEPKKPFYLTGQVGDRAFSVHAEGERVYLVNEDGEKEEVELTAKTEGVPEESSSGGDPESLTPHGEVGPQHLDDELPPGASPLDLYVRREAEVDLGTAAGDATNDDTAREEAGDDERD
jgi:transposase InsO family protein